MQSIRRSLLFVPGIRPERFEKARASGADVICIDLEDACLPEEKAAARQTALDYIASAHSPESIVLRVNSPRTPYGFEDIAAIIGRNDLPALTIMLPKVASPVDVQLIDQALSQKNIELIALIESAEGIGNAMNIASASPRLTALMFGGGDLSAELGTTLDWEPMYFSRCQLALAAASRQLELIDVPYLDIRNDDELYRESNKVKALGYTCKAAIHPNQIKTINKQFTPTQTDIERARKIVSAYQSCDGGALLVDGRMIDLPLVVASERTVAIAEKLGL